MEILLSHIAEKKKKLDAHRPLPPALAKKLDEWFNLHIQCH
jgi:hypothetical protein